MFEGQLAYVSAAYLITAFVLGGAVAWVLIDRAKQKRALATLQAAGIKRRGDDDSDIT